MRIPPLTLVLAATATAFLAPPAAAVPNVAHWNGPATVAACGVTTCVSATSTSCTAVTAGSGPAGCTATLTGSLTGPGCAGTGTGSVVLREATGEEHTVSVTLAAARGAVAFTGRYVFLFDRTAFLVDGAIDCDSSTWHGTFKGRGL